MSAPCLVSILIPCYNAARWLRAALDSALAQNSGSTEVVVVDDGSNDESRAIAECYVSRGVRLFTQPNLGASAARNRAIVEARGSFFQFLDADDVLATDKISRQVAVAERKGRDVLYSGSWGRFTGLPSEAQFVPEPLCADLSPVDFMTRKLSANAMMHPAAWLVSRELANAAGPWDERLSLDDDGEYFTRVVLASKRIECVTEARSYYRSNLPQSLSQRRSDRAWASQFLSTELSVSHLLAVENSKRTRRACADALQRLVYEAYPSRRDLRKAASQRVAELGGSDLRYRAGPKYEFVARLFGWRIAKRLRNLSR